MPGGEDYNNYWGFNPELGIKREVHPTCQMKRLIIVRAARRRTPVLATCHHHNNYHHDYHVMMVNSPKKAAGTAALLGGAFSTTVSPAKTFAAGFYNLWTILYYLYYILYYLKYACSKVIHYKRKRTRSIEFANNLNNAILQVVHTLSLIHI